jgi:membrane fusion protein, multidrug efflux system
LAFQVSGLLVEFPVREGQEVSEGELIGRLRPDEFEARLAALQGQLDQARARLQALRMGEREEERRRRAAQVRATEARLVNARTEYERFSRLMRTNSVAVAEFEASQAAYLVAQEEHQIALEMVAKGMVGREEDILAMEAEVRSLEGRVVEANLQVQDSTLRAPYNGVIAQRFVEEGQNVRAKDPIVRFQDVEEVEIAVDVPETVMAADIRLADIMQLTAEVSGAPGLQFPVTIRELAQVADPTTQTFNVRVAMASPTEIRVLPGMTATVTAVYRRASILGTRLLVPISTLFQTDSGEQVAWVIGADDTVTRRPVKVGAALGGQVEILEGLEPGERIAVAGATFLRDGMRVRDLGDALSAVSGGTP